MIRVRYYALQKKVGMKNYSYLFICTYVSCAYKLKSLRIIIKCVYDNNYNIKNIHSLFSQCVYFHLYVEQKSILHCWLCT